MAKKTAAPKVSEEKAAPVKKRAAVKKSAAKSEKPVEAEPVPPDKAFAISLPSGVKPGVGIACRYGKETSLARGLDELDDNCYGTFHALVEAVTDEYLTVLFVYPDGTPPEKNDINLENGIDETAKCAVDEIRISPIPNAQLTKWKTKGLANASARPEEEIGEAEGGADDDVPFEEGGEGEEVDYQ
jgi:hypothetical protein